MLTGSGLYDLTLSPANHLIDEHFPQLKDVAKGLIYMHDQEMVHGDLKGVSVSANPSHPPAS
jgi:hypothetical protein